MDLRDKINALLSLEKFNNLNDKQKSTVFECIFAHCLILSKENQDRYLQTIEECVSKIEDLGNNSYTKNGACYDGIVMTDVVRKPKDVEGFIFPLNYEVLYKEFNSPLNRLTRSALHEFGHVVIKKQDVNLYKVKPGKNGVFQIDMGGLVINNGFKGDFGHTFTEIINEFTTFLAFKAYISYEEISEYSENKMNAFAQNMGLTIEKRLPHLEILPDNLFTSYTEEYLARNEKNEMFNPIYVKYSPLIKFIMSAFQNPCFTYNDLKEAFRNGEGLSAIKNGEPINDLLYGYYESSFRPKEVFDEFMSDDVDWETLCKDFDKEMYESSVNIDFINNYINKFIKFYEKRNTKYLKEGLITSQKYDQNISDFYEVLDSCKEHYNLNLKK